MSDENKNKNQKSYVSQVNRDLEESAIFKEAQELELPYVNLSKLPLNPDYLKLIDFEKAKTGKIISFFKVGKKLRVGVEDPNNPNTKKIIEELKKSGYEIEPYLSSKDSIKDALTAYHEQSEKYKKKEIVKTIQESAIETYEKEIKALSNLPKKLETITPEEGLNLLNISAIKTKASDIHYEPEEKTVVVRLRIDGVLHKIFELNHKLYSKIANQIKYESKMKLNINTVPQDGRYSFDYNEKKVGVRVSSIPTPYGESFVCRFLISGEKTLNFEELGFSGNALKKLQKAAKISHGMILATGPTGSGKTTTLYSILDTLNTSQNKIITLEDPVEYNIKGVTQSQINENRGYDFANGLKTVLRQDPDIVMLGEIRDLETSETAAQAALTGHIVLSTLHTNSAIETIPRLINMGLPPFMVAPALDTIIGQRLVRKVCPHCSTLEPLSDSEKTEFEEIMESLKNINPNFDFKIPEKIPQIHGCEKCSQTGYIGRLVLAEVVNITSAMKDLILKNASVVKLIELQRKEGIITIKEDGFLKVSEGLTTLSEVFRVTNISGAYSE